MSLSELLVTLIVALCVFRPKQLPTLARHLGHAINRMERFKQAVMHFWQTQQAKQGLEENTQKALEADKTYLTNESVKK